MLTCFSTLACPDFSWQDIYSMAKDFNFDGIEIRGLGNDIFSVKAPPFKDSELPKTVVIPEGVKEIWFEAFKGCVSLTSIVITEGVETEDQVSFLHRHDNGFINMICHGDGFGFFTVIDLR